ncbi:hypothetical protein QWZ13_16880 [Reinekea marina]|nr:hypothetical protein [Reinekea marina]MDN3650582.1 hypothetical protein [Reinekea marina]
MPVRVRPLVPTNSEPREIHFLGAFLFKRLEASYFMHRYGIHSI